MWSRRQFVSTLLGSCALWLNYKNNSALALYKAAGHAKINLRLMMSEYWPPAISCSFLDVFGDNYCCMADDVGSLAIAELSTAASHSTTYPNLGEINNLGDKILFLKMVQSQKALLIAEWQKDKNSSGREKRHKRKADKTDTQFICYLINLASVQEPFIESKSIIADYSQLNSFAVSNVKNHPILCLSGIDSHGENRVSIYSLKVKNKLQTLSSIKLKEVAKALLLGNEILLILHETNQVSKFDLNDIGNPKPINTLALGDQISAIANYNDTCVWASENDGKNILTISNLRTFPQAISKTVISGSASIDSLAMSEKYIFILGLEEENVAVLPFSIEKNYTLKQEETLPLAGFLENSTVRSRIAIGKEAAFISSGWSGTQVVSVNHKGIWSATTYYSLQQLPVVNMALWSNYLLLAGRELQLYDVNQSKKPRLINTTKLANAVKAIVCAGSYALCLDKSVITLRKIEKPAEALVKVNITGDYLTFDKVTHKAYLVQIADSDNIKTRNIETENVNTENVNRENVKIENTNTENIGPESIKIDSTKEESAKEEIKPGKLVELNVYNNSLETTKTFSILENVCCCSADEGYVLVGSQNFLAIYKPDQSEELVCKREFKNLAWRKIILSKGNIFATAIDQKANGFFLTMSFDGQVITSLSSITLTHDGLSLTVKDDNAFAVGQEEEGNSLLTAIDISNINKPKIISQKPVLQSASAIATNNNLLIVCGQGFEIFSI